MSQPTVSLEAQVSSGGVASFAMPLSQIFAVRELTAMILDLDHRAWLVAPREVLRDFELWMIAWATMILQLDELENTEPPSEHSDFE